MPTFSFGNRGPLLNESYSVFQKSGDLTKFTSSVTFNYMNVNLMFFQIPVVPII